LRFPMNPRATAIVPCHPRNRPTLARTLESVEAAAKGLGVETVVVDDIESRGSSWARNEGLRRAKGDVVFFLDADDTVKPAFFKRMLDVLEASGADLAMSSFECAPLKRDYSLSGNAAIREAMLPAFFGYTFDDVRRWNAGGDLDARRDLGSVCRCAFRRAFVEAHSIRFDEGLRVYEDAPFLAECACFADRVVSMPDVLYDYVPGEAGNTFATTEPDRYYAYKFAALANRKAIASRAGFDVLQYFGASVVFSALELFRARRGFFRYAEDPVVARAFEEFPVSARHPVAALAVKICGVLARHACNRQRRGE